MHVRRRPADAQLRVHCLDRPSRSAWGLELKTLARRGHSRGSHNTNVLPFPCSLRTVIAPPSASTMRALMASPTPIPGPAVGSSRTNSWNRSRCSSWLIPGTSCQKPRPDSHARPARSHRRVRVREGSPGPVSSRADVSRARGFPQWLRRVGQTTAIPTRRGLDEVTAADLVQRDFTTTASRARLIATMR